MLKTLRIKFVCMMMAVITVMLCVIFGMVIHFTALGLENQSIQMMQEMAANPVPYGRPDLTYRTGQIQLPFFAVQIGSKGELISTGGGYYDLSDEKTLLEITLAAFSAQEKVGVLHEYGLRYTIVSGTLGKQVIFADMSSENATMNELVKNCAMIGIFSLAVFLAISIAFANWAVKPVDHAWQQQRQFVADASHELKTPLAVIMTNAELLEYPEYDEETKAQFLHSILAMTNKMRGLVERLLEMARIDSGSVKMNYVSLDISSLIRQEAEPFEALCFEKSLTLNISIEEDIRVKGSEFYLRQLPAILLDNAIKYTIPESEIHARLIKSGSHCTFCVASPGAELSREDLTNIFKRFYRVDKVRGSEGSYGLGLSIAQAIVEDHRGKIWAESENGINTFYIRLPAS